MSQRRTSAADAPLLAWGDALRAGKIQRRARCRRAALAALGGAVVLGTALFPPLPRLVWNASASAPEGLYAVSPRTSPRSGDMVIAWAPRPWRRLAAERHYVPLDVPLVKRVAASSGDEVCALGAGILVNGRWVAERRAADGAGRPMPRWIGCVRLRGREVFLLMDNPASFDGRYFGVTAGKDVIGKARLLWRR